MGSLQENLFVSNQGLKFFILIIDLMLMKLFPILRSLSSGCPKGHESASCSPPE